MIQITPQMRVLVALQLLRGDDLHANPDARFFLQAGDMVAIIGTDEARRALRSIAAPALEPSKEPADG